MKINEVVDEGWLNALGQVGKEFVGGHNVDSTVDAAKAVGQGISSVASKFKRSPKISTATSAPATQDTFSEPVTIPGQEPYVKGPQGWVNANDKTTPAPSNLLSLLDRAWSTIVDKAKAANAATTSTYKTVGLKNPAPGIAPSRAPTQDQSLMVQQMRQQQGLPARPGTKPAPKVAAPTTKTPSTMVQQMRQQAADQAAARQKASSLLKAPRNVYGQPSQGGTPIPLTPAERLPRRPQVYRNPVQHESIEESVDLAEVLWQKMKRLQANES